MSMADHLQDTPLPDTLNRELFSASSPDVEEMNPRGSKRKKESLSPSAPPLSDELLKPPAHVDPWIGEMIKAIRINTDATRQDIGNLNDRVRELEDYDDLRESKMCAMNEQVNQLQISNKTLLGRLLRVENKMQQQENHISDLTARSMRENIIIKTVGDKYKELQHENTDATIRRFLAEELHIADVNSVTITRSHRMGQAGGGYNKALIAKLPFDDDIKRIFANVGALKGTEYSISNQIPSEYNERRQFAWSTFKQAKADKKKAVFSGASLYLENKLVDKFSPHQLPSAGNLTLGKLGAKYLSAEGDDIQSSGHTFKACVTKINSMQDIRDAHDVLLHKYQYANASHLSYAYRIADAAGNVEENFDSNGNSGVGMQILRRLRKENATDAVCFVAHTHKKEPIAYKNKTDSIEQTVSGGMLAMRNVLAASPV